MNISVERRHYTTKEIAINKIDEVDIKDLVNSNLPLGVKVNDTKKSWLSDDELSFTLKAKRGRLIKVDISGTAKVGDDTIIILVNDIPVIATAFISLAKMEEEIKRQLDILFPKEH
jgi:hypothetical protein